MFPRTFPAPPSASRLALCVGLGWASLAGTALAQTPAPGGPDPDPDEVQIDDVIVTGMPFGISARATTLATTVLNDEALAVAPAASLGDLVSGLPGVRSTDFAPGASRPIIRGLSGPRVQVLTNGIGLIDASSVSPDHQVATDPAEARRIEIIRGPATLAYGGTAIGGVVNVIDARIPEDLPDGIDGRLSLQGSSVDGGRLASARLTAAAGAWAFTVDGLSKRADDYDIPVPSISRQLADRDGLTPADTGTQPNSFAELQSWGAGASWIGERGYVGASFKDLSSTYGVVAEEGVFIELEQTRYDVRGALDFSDGPLQSLRGAWGQSDYTHTEFEGPGEPGTVFLSEGQEARLDLVLRPRGGWNGAIGVQVLDRQFVARGDEAYLPASNIEEAGLYTVQRLDRPGWGLEGGLRYDRRRLAATPLSGGPEQDLTFGNWSGSAAIFARPGRDLFVGLGAAYNSRAPSEVELFADGLHVATAAYETGDPGLESEKVSTLEATAHYDAGRLRGDLHIYVSHYDGFIDERPTGAVFIDGGETYPVFAFVQTHADFKGFEAEAAYDLWSSGSRTLTLEVAADLVQARTDLGPAARIPPWSLTGRAIWQAGPIESTLELRHVGRQTRLADYELPTDSYTLINLSGLLRPFGQNGPTVFLEARNLADVEAREHASFLKDIAPQPGRSLRLGVSYSF